VIRQKIIFGLVTAISALAFFATPALAENWECNEGTKCTVKVEGKGQQKFIVETTAFECRTARGEGQVEGKKKDLQYKPTFRLCSTKIAGVKHEVKVEPKCEFRLTITEQSGKPPKAQGTVSLKGSCIVLIFVVGTTCEIKIGEQGPLKKFRAEQVGKGKERQVQVLAEVPGIKGTATTGCGFAKTAVEGKYEGKARFLNVKIREG